MERNGDGESDSRVPIKMGEFSVMDSEFNNIKGRFDTEMKRMEEEMNKFRSELINRESSSFRKAASRCANNLLIIPNYLISNSKSSLSSI